MPRYKRIRDPWLLRHVMSRGNGRMQIFLDDTDYRKFLYILSDVVEEYDLDCWDVCVMPNHYHLAVMSRQPNLPEAMQHLNGEYGTWWNGRHARVGHVFQGRYKDQIVQRETYLRNLLTYIALNPVRARLVKSPELWPWSGFRCTAGYARSPGFLASELVLAQFGDADREVLRERYRQHVLAALPEDEESFKPFRSRQRIVGGREFRRIVLRGSALLERPRTTQMPPGPAGIPSVGV
jgi:REP element-mobilizing transposase RayT